jgi:hypothetical protein
MTEIKAKICIECHKTKPIDQFNGRKCKACTAHQRKLDRVFNSGPVETGRAPSLKPHITAEMFEAQLERTVAALDAGFTRMEQRKRAEMISAKLEP